jgi:hypothetical protein
MMGKITDRPMPGRENAMIAGKHLGRVIMA